MTELEKKQYVFNGIINELFARIYNYNSNLLSKCNKGDECNYDEVFDFYITSNAISFLKNVYLGFITSQTFFLNIRCIIEGLAVKKAFKKNYFTITNFNLLKVQAPIIEYHQYKEFQNILDECLFKHRVLKGYNEAKNVFQQSLPNLSNKEFNKVLRSQIPFSGNSKMTYKKIIYDNLGEEMAEAYGFLSTIVHPNSNYKKNTSDLLQVIVLTIERLRLEYSKKKQGTKDLKRMDTFVKLSPDAKAFEEIINEICINFKTISDYFEKNFGENYVSFTFTDLSNIYKEVASDLIFGFVEQVKSKYKVILELLASFHYVYIESDHVNQVFQLLKYNEFINSSNKDSNIKFDKQLKQGYEAYKEIYKNGVSYDLFVKKFSNKLGYTINENGDVKTYNELVKDFCNIFDVPDDSISLPKVLKLNYVESQMLSHANGYMWFANSGAWGDINNVFVNLNIMLAKICFTMYIIFKNYYDQSNEYKYKKMANLLKKAYKYINNSQLMMIEILNKRNGIIAQ